MKFKRSDIFAIAKKPYELGGDKSNIGVDYNKWVDFINKNSTEFVWYENTKNGIETILNFDSIPDNFKDRIKSSLNKKICYKDFDIKKKYYNINIGYNNTDNIIQIGFEKAPKLNELRIFIEMANYLNALLLVNGKTIINEKMIK